MLVYLYFDSNKKYNAVFQIQKERNQTGPIHKFYYKNQTPTKRKCQNGTWQHLLYIINYCTFFVFSNVVVFMSAVLKDF